LSVNEQRLGTEMESQFSSQPIQSAAIPSSGQAWYLVAVLSLFYVFSFIDRQIISLLVEPIKRDLGMIDTHIGLLQGMSFAFFYCFFGILIARLADTANRKVIISIGIVVWSAMAALCGLAKSSWQLVAARIGVGVGEAALSPAAYSMITDAFPREKLGRAFSVYNMGISIGSGIALLAGGLIVGAVSDEGRTFTLPLIGEVRAWQFVFIVTGAPGILLPLLLLSVREPARRGLMKVASGGQQSSAHSIPLNDVFAFMHAGRFFYSMHFLGLSMIAMVGYAAGAWLPTVMARTYGFTPAYVGQVLGISALTLSAFGIFVIGRVCDRLTAKGISDAPMWLCIGSAIAITLTSSFPAFMPSGTLGLVMMCIASFPFHGCVAMGPLAVNQVTPNQMRAQVSAVYLFTVNLIGLGLGPALVPVISDYILRDPMQIRWGLLTVVVGAGITGTILLWLARPAFQRRLNLAAEWQ
jgi:MFS family permease